MKHYKFSIRKYFYATIVVLTAVIAPALAQTNLNLDPNLVINNSFEEGATGWHIAPDTATIVNGIAHDGENSLYYKNTDEKQYKMFTQQVNVEPGQHLKFSAWLKGKNITGPQSEGASLFMQSYAGDKYQGGSFPGRLRGTFDWKQVSGIFVVPEGATKISVGLYLRKGVTGEVWFDDVEVRVENPAPFQSYLQSPNYRNLVKQGDNSAWKFDIQINQQKDWKPNPLKIKTTLTDSSGKILLNNSTEANSGKDYAKIAITPPADLPVGDYTLKQTIKDPNNVQRLQETHKIRVVEEMPKVYIDAQGFTVVDGKRFFPMGVYLGRDSNGEEHLKRISKSGFNTVLSYSYGIGKDPQTFMRNAHKHNLKVVYSVKDMYPNRHNYSDEAYDIAAKYITEMSDNPALLAWYTNDELGENWLPELSKMYDQTKQLDPDHPTFQVLYQTAIMKKYFSVTDILGGDPYPVGSADLTKTATDTRITVDAARGANGVWMVPQMMDWGVYREERKTHPPSLDEMLNQAYQALINGAKGLIWYSYYDIKYKKYPRGKDTEDMKLFHQRWKDITAMSAEINKVIPTILSDKKVELNITDNIGVEIGAWEQEDKLALLMANPYYEEKTVSFALPRGWQIPDANQGQIKSTFTDGKVNVTLPSIGSGIFMLVKN